MIAEGFDFTCYELVEFLYFLTTHQISSEVLWRYDVFADHQTSSFPGLYQFPPGIADRVKSMFFTLNDGVVTFCETNEKKLPKKEVDSKSSFKRNTLTEILSKPNVPTNHELCRLYNMMQNIKCSLTPGFSVWMLRGKEKTKKLSISRCQKCKGDKSEERGSHQPT